MHCVILAGGSGTRFWPYSRKDNPKQLLNIVGDKTMLQITIDRLRKLKSTSEIYIITKQELYESILKSIKHIKAENIIVEPSAKNTAPAIALVAQKIFMNNKNAVMGVFPADHLIVGHNHFEKSLNSAFSLVKKEQILVTIGIQPSYPSTAYGYIQYEPGTKNKNGYHVKTFAEKPHETLAKRFIKSGDFLWNAGIFVWEVKSLLLSLEKHMPDLHDAIKKIGLRIEKSDSFDDIWESILPESIDYGLMEKANNIVMVHGNFSWSDVGSWDSLEKLFTQDKNDNTFIGKIDSYKSSKNTVYSKNKSIKLLGVEGLIIVESDDGILVCKKGYEQDIKKTNL